MSQTKLTPGSNKWIFQGIIDDSIMNRLNQKVDEKIKKYDKIDLLIMELSYDIECIQGELDELATCIPTLSGAVKQKALKMVNKLERKILAKDRVLNEKEVEKKIVCDEIELVKSRIIEKLIRIKNQRDVAYHYVEQKVDSLGGFDGNLLARQIEPLIKEYGLSVLLVDDENHPSNIKNYSVCSKEFEGASDDDDE